MFNYFHISTHNQFQFTTYEYMKRKPIKETKYRYPEYVSGSISMKDYLKAEFDVKPEPQGLYAHPNLSWPTISNNSCLFAQHLLNKISLEAYAQLTQEQLADWFSTTINNSVSLSFHLESLLQIKKDDWAEAISGSGFIE